MRTFLGISSQVGLRSSHGEASYDRGTGSFLAKPFSEWRGSLSPNLSESQSCLGIFYVVHLSTFRITTFIFAPKSVFRSGMGLLDRGASEPGWYTSVVVCLRTGLHKHRVVPHQRDREDFGWFSTNEIVNILGNLLVNGFAETLGGSVVPHTRDCKDNQYNCCLLYTSDAADE